MIVWVGLPINCQIVHTKKEIKMKKLLMILLLVVAFVLSGCYSCESRYASKGLGAVPPHLAGTSYWSDECKTWAAAQRTPAPAPPARPTAGLRQTPARITAVRSKPQPASECGPYTASTTYPTTGVIRLDKKMPKEVTLNAPFDYSIDVTNLTDMVVTHVLITEQLAEHFKFSSASPAPMEREGKLSWHIPVLEPRQSTKIKVTGVATDAECLKHCATVTYVVPNCANVMVVQTKLRLDKTAPAEVLVCDPIPVKLKVTNTGTGTARNIKIVDPLPNGLRTADGKSTLSFNVASLGVGQSREFSANLAATKTGKYVNKATAKADAGLEAESAPVQTIVRQAALAIKKTGAKMRYLGRPVSYLIEISNTGDAVAKNIALEDTIPAGMKFVSANHLGTPQGGKVVWSLPPLAPGKTKLVEVTYSTDRAGTFSDRATVKAACVDPVSASATTLIKGVAAVLLEVIDLDDPIELGSLETYVVTVTNQGSADSTNVSIVCTLEDNVQYRSTAGPTTASVSGKTVTFAPLARLAPKAKATWRVVVKAVKSGDVRFTVAMNTDQLGRPVDETESTEMYE